MNFSLLLIYFLFWLLLLMTSMAFDRAWFFVLCATFRVYKKRVANGVANYELSGDELDKTCEEFSDNNGDYKILTGEENEGQKRLDKKYKFDTIYQNTPNYLIAFVPLRLLAYGFLVIGFLALKRQEMLNISAFLIALAIMPLGALIYGLIKRYKFVR